MSYAQSLRREEAHVDGIWCVCWPRSGAPLVTGSVDGAVKLWAPETLESRVQFDAHPLGVLSVTCDDSGRVCAASSMDSLIAIYDLERGQRVNEIGKKSAPMDIWTTCITPDSKYVVAGGQSGKAQLYDVEKGGNPTASYETRGPFIMSVKFSPDGRLLACGSKDGLVTVFDAESRALLYRLEGHSLCVRALSFTPDSAHLITGSDDKHIHVYSMADGRLVGSVSGHSSWVVSVDASPDRRHFASSSTDHHVKVWDLRTREAVTTFGGYHTDQVWGVAYSPTGAEMVSVGSDRQIIKYTCVVDVGAGAGGV